MVQLARKHNIEMPIAETVLAILENKLSPMDAMRIVVCARDEGREALNFVFDDINSYSNN